jgi:hypothetical protein
MGRRHVARAAEVLGAVPSAGSGNRWQNPADGRSPHDSPYPVALEGKSTRGKSLTVTLDMIAKLREQALGETPVLPLCWYGTDDLTEVTEDWAAVPLDFLGEILAQARAMVVLETALGNIPVEDLQGLILKAGTADDLRRALKKAHDDLLDAGEKIGADELELYALRDIVKNAGQQQDVPQAQFVPRLPWTVVHLSPKSDRWWAGDQVGIMVKYDPDGMQHVSPVTSARVQPSPGNRPHLFVENFRIRNGDLYGADGMLQARVCEGDPAIEVG